MQPKDPFFMDDRGDGGRQPLLNINDLLQKFAQNSNDDDTIENNSNHQCRASFGSPLNLVLEETDTDLTSTINASTCEESQENDTGNIYILLKTTFFGMLSISMFK